jgi:signal peptidase II
MSSLSRPTASSAPASLKDAKSTRSAAGNPYQAPDAARKAGVASSAQGVALSRYVLFAVIAVGGCLTDLATKSLIFTWRGEPRPDNVWWIWEGYFGIETALNPGALFGMGRQFGPLFAALSVAAGVGILYWLFVRGAAKDLTLTIALSSVMGGILGNLYDRLGFGQPLDAAGHWQTEVRDWILFRYQDYTWPNFNIADCMLVCGAALLMWHAISHREPKPESAKSASD